MARCKYCGARIDKLDKDICPFCGGKSPIDDMNMTQDFTKEFDAIKMDIDDVPSFKKRSTAGLLALFFGFLGVNFFYLRKIRTGIISLLVSLLLIGVIGTLLMLFTSLSFYSYFIFYGILELNYIVIAINYFTRSDIKDGKGDLLH